MITRIKVKAGDGYAQLTLLKPTAPMPIDGYNLLLERMLELASDDLTGTDQENRFDAMDFFRSEWFNELTDLDGEAIIQKLLA